jgi:hypothetical protein
VTNAGTADLLIGTVVLAGTNAADFVKQTDGCSGLTLVPAGTCTVGALFDPARGGAKSANLNIPSNDPDTATLPVVLTGQGVEPVDPYEGTIGTQANLLGAGFGTATGKAWLDVAGKAVKWSVLGWSDTAIQALWKKKTAPGTYNVFAQPKGKGTTPVQVGSFDIKAPEISTLVPNNGAAGSAVALNGRFFATPKKPKVYFSGGGLAKPKKCKVTSSGMTAIQFAVPKVDPGIYDVQVVNKIGASAVAAGAFTVLVP